MNTLRKNILKMMKEHDADKISINLYGTGNKLGVQIVDNNPKILKLQIDYYNLVKDDRHLFKLATDFGSVEANASYAFHNMIISLERFTFKNKKGIQQLGTNLDIYHLYESSESKDRIQMESDLYTIYNYLYRLEGRGKKTKARDLYKRLCEKFKNKNKDNYAS